MTKTPFDYYWSGGVEFWFWLIVFMAACSYGFILGLNSEPYDFSCWKEWWKSETLPNRPKGTSLGEKLLNPEETSEPEDTKTSLTDQSVIDDAVSGLVNLGYKRKLVFPLVLDLVEVKQYDNPMDLVKDVFKHAKK